MRHARKAGLFAAAVVVAFGTFDSARAACVTVVVNSLSPASGPAGTAVTITLNQGTVDNISFGGTTVSVTQTGEHSYVVTAPAGSGTVNVVVTVVPRIQLCNTQASSTFTYSGSSSSDSDNVRNLQIAGTTTSATISGQVITEQVGGSIDGAFNGGGNPVTGGPGGFAVNFAAEPQSPISQRTDDAFSALAYAAVPRKAPTLIEREWSAWADLRGTGFRNGDTLSGLQGSQYNLTAGLGRKLTPNLLVGVYAGYEHMSYDANAFSGNITGNGGSVGGYFGWRVGMFRLDGLLGYTGLGYSAAAGTASGSFNGNRLLASSTLSTAFTYQMLVILPSASIYALWERQSAWTDSLGTAQAERNFSAGRTSFGGKVMRPVGSGDIVMSPYVGLYSDWRFATDNAVPAGQPLVGIGNGWSARTTGGIAFAARSGATFNIGGEYAGIGAAYQIWTGRASASLPF